MTDNTLDAAYGYAALGMHVFPLYHPTPNGCACGDPECDDIGKHPRTTHGFLDATTDRKQITKWWMAHDEYGIGIRTGKVSGIVVIDVDPRHGGHVTLDELLAKHGPL